MSWSKKQEENRICMAWLKDPLLNPETGRPIEKDGPKYKEFQSRCRKLDISDRPVATGVMTWRKCQEWRKHPGVNPETGRKLAINGDKYKNIENQCLKIEKELKINILGEYPKPDSSGLVPAYIESGVGYILRNYQGRAVFGPLNRYSKKAVKIYFKNTWDYINGYYKPIFIGMREPQPQIYFKNQKKENPKYIVDSFLNIFMK